MKYHCEHRPDRRGRRRDGGPTIGVGRLKGRNMALESEEAGDQSTARQIKNMGEGKVKVKINQQCER